MIVNLWNVNSQLFDSVKKKQRRALPSISQFKFWRLLLRNVELRNKEHTPCAAGGEFQKE